MSGDLAAWKGRAGQRNENVLNKPVCPLSAGGGMQGFGPVVRERR